MPRPILGACGGDGQPACPPVPAVVDLEPDFATSETPYYTFQDMLAYGKQCYDKGIIDRAQEDSN